MENNKIMNEAIETKNIFQIRNGFYTIAHEDRNFSTGYFESTLEYVKRKNIPGLFQPFDGEVFKKEEEWNEEYWAWIAASLMDNFCEERIQHLKQIGRKIYPKKKEDQTAAKEKRIPDLRQDRTEEKRQEENLRGTEEAPKSLLSLVGIGVGILIVLVVIVLLRKML